MFNELKELYSMLSKRNKIIVLFLFFGIIFESFFELLGISSILPIVEILSEDAPLSSNSIASVVCTIFHTTDRSTVVLILILIVSLIYIFKAFFSFLMTFFINKFSFTFQKQLTCRLMGSFLALPYEYHLNHNSSELLNVLSYDVGLCANAVNCFLTLASQSLICLFLLVYLFFTDVIITLIVIGVLFLVSIIVLLYLKKRVVTVGKLLQKEKIDNYKEIIEIFSSIKEIRLTQSCEYFSKQFGNTQERMNKSNLKFGVFSALPKNVLETFGMISLLVALGVVLFFHTATNAEIVVKFSSFAVATIKILPSVNTINSSLNTLQFCKASVASIHSYDELDKKELQKERSIAIRKATLKPSFESKLRFDEVTFKYSSGEKDVLSNVSLEISKGDFVAVCGKSGSGKTTLINLILGLLQPSSGTITCDGVDISNNINEWQRQIAYIPQSIAIIDSSIKRNVAFGISDEQIDTRLVESSLRNASLSDLILSLPDGIETIVGENGARLSGGQKQRIGIARAFYRNASVLILDEATNALDVSTENAILNEIELLHRKNPSLTLILITHKLTSISMCSKVFSINEGTITQTR